jgi:hypothetical protein
VCRCTLLPHPRILRLRVSSGAAGLGGGGGDPLATKLDERSMQQLFSVLREHMEGVKQLQDVLRRDVRDVEVMRPQSLSNGGVDVVAIEYI